MRGTGLSMIAAAAAVATSQALRFELSNVLGNNMVLQREPAEASVWGFSDPGQAVYATFKDQVSNDTWAIQSITDQAGQWTLPMPSRPADNHTYELVISSEPDPALYKWSGVVMLLTNIVYGDVLFFSGQSNMQGKQGGALEGASKKMTSPVAGQPHTGSVFHPPLAPPAMQCRSHLLSTRLRS